MITRDPSPGWWLKLTSRMTLCAMLALLCSCSTLLPWKGEPAPAGTTEAAAENQTKGIMVPMRDGVRLCTDVHLPEGDGPFPAVLARSVYGRGLGEGFAEMLNPKGIAFVCQDTRGRGGSKGEDRVFQDDAWGERQDGADTVEWIRSRAWCNGGVATFGGSALGITSLLQAPATPGLKCQVVWVAPSKFYGYLSYQGGVFRKHLLEGWLTMQKVDYMIDVWHSHPSDDAFWDGFDTAKYADRVTAPGLHVGGWWDIFNQGTIDAFATRQYKGGEGARGTQRLIMGPWTHAGPNKEAGLGEMTLPENSLIDLMKLSREYLEFWLLGEDYEWLSKPPVQYYTVGDLHDPGAPGNEWRYAENWPPFPAKETPLYLSANGELGFSKPGEGRLAYTYDPADPCPTMGGANLIPIDKDKGLKDLGPRDQRPLKERGDVLSFATAPLTEPLEITGRVKVRLFVSSDAPDTDFTAKLLDIYPDGREMLMLDNIQRVKYRNGFKKPDPLEPNTVGELEIDLWSISLIINTGHRIGVQISSSNYPRFEKNPNTGADLPVEGEELRPANNTVYMGGAQPSALILPVRQD